MVSQYGTLSAGNSESHPYGIWKHWRGKWPAMVATCESRIKLVCTRARQTCRALQKYMHEFNADRDHAMCNIQNRSIQAVQLTQLRKLSNKIFHGTGVLHSSESCQVLQCKVAARQWRCLAEIVSFSGSCSRCLVLSPLPCPTLPKQPKLVCGYCVKGMSVVQGAVPCQQQWYQEHAIRGVAGVHTS
jgi:hypothetical protein